MNKYIVKLSYHYFTFGNPYAAMDFAETAKRHYMDGRDSDLDVSIEIIREEPEDIEVESREE